MILMLEPVSLNVPEKTILECAFRTESYPD